MSRSRQKRADRRVRKDRVRARRHPSFAGVLYTVWRRARTVWQTFFEAHDCSIRELLAMEVVLRWKHRAMAGWLFHLEALVRSLILAAALTIRVVLRARPSARRVRRKRSVIVWDNKPETWRRLSFHLFPRTGAPHRGRRNRNVSLTVPSLLIARRLETLRRVLADPEACARRAAFRLARMAAVNQRSNQKRRIVLDGHSARTRRPSRGEQWTREAFEQLAPVLADNLDAWPHPPEAG